MGAEPALRARRTAVLDVVGLTPALLARMPRLASWAAGRGVATVAPVLPAVTCSMQATYLTGAPPARHGVVANGWYFRDECEVKFWRQSNRLVQQPKIWELAKQIDPAFTCASLFWWFNMYSSADVGVTPRPMYPADGRKIPDVWTRPAELRESLQHRLGAFPLFHFWGPATSIRSSEWIAAAAHEVEGERHPTLSLVYLPHLDYALQRHGPTSPAIERDLGEIDRVACDLIDFYEAHGVETVVLSEYGISEVRRPIALNRVLREHGYLALREELGHELLDAGVSKVFAVADHQLAHVYVADAADIPAVRALLETIDGVERVHGRSELPELDHPRAGELIAIAEPDAWFSYYYWFDDARAPDFARTVDIHRKPGYDPAELFLDPRLRSPRLRIARRLAQKKLGFRTLLDVIPLDASLVRGSHGRSDAPEAPVVIGTRVHAGKRYPATAVMDLLLEHLFRDESFLSLKAIGVKP